MIDTHSHIYVEEFADDVDEVVSRAKQAGIEKILLPNINMESVEPMLALCHRYPGYLYPMMGLHPEDVKEDWEQLLSEMETMLQQPGSPFVAVGEVGLDFYWDKTFSEEQKKALDVQIRWAVRYGLPLMIHCRDAHDELLEALAPYKGTGLKGVFHCFGGTPEQAHSLLEHEGFVLGIGGVLTFKKSPLPAVLAETSLDRIVVETDAPYLAPVPYRGKRNESAYCVEVFKKLAELYQVTPEEVSIRTNMNVRRIFGVL
ncbi:MAG: TatD family hydrolase [Bacteroidaceae bacterium]|nr:TatD family hydrolase [Bacteroidaceae bacterium]